MNDRIESDASAALALLEAESARLAARIAELEAIPDELDSLRAERGRVVSAIEALTGRPAKPRKPRVARGVPARIVAEYLELNPHATDESVMILAESEGVSRSAARRALREARSRVVEMAS